MKLEADDVFLMQTMVEIKMNSLREQAVDLNDKWFTSDSNIFSCNKDIAFYKQA